MDRTERFYKIDKMLQERKVVPKADFLKELQVSLATFKRDLEYMRERFNAPIIWDADAGGYRFDRQGYGDRYELPGLWFNAAEIQALLTMRQLLTTLGPGLLTPHVEPLLARLRMLLESEGIAPEAFEKRIRIQRLSARAYEPEHFTPVVSGLLQRKRLVIDHYSRARDETVRRLVSPQRLTHYQENWYLDAWCHLREEIRKFSLDSIRSITLSSEAALDVPEEELTATLDAGYGAYAGKDVAWAELEFSRKQAKWISREVWHQNQRGAFTEDGNYRLHLPYSDPRELAMNILRYVPEVKVISPPELKELVLGRLRKALENG